jgi:opacity protein-like surface antigen
MRIVFSAVRLVAIAALLVPMGANAERTPYLGVGVINWMYDPDRVDDVEATGALFTLGSQLSPNFSIEGRFATGGSDTVGTFDADVELDSLFSIMAKPHTSGDNVRGYGLLGFSDVDLSADRGARSVEADDNGFSYGAGVEFAVGESGWINFEYANYLDEDDYTFDGWTIGARFEF